MRASRTASRATSRALSAAALTFLLAACATGGGQGGQGSRRGAAEPQPRPEQNWPIKTRYQLDLWLHGYAMVQQDTTLVPYFKRGYRESIMAAKNMPMETWTLAALVFRLVTWHAPTEVAPLKARIARQLDTFDQADIA